MGTPKVTSAPDVDPALKELVERFFTAWCEGDLEAAPTFLTAISAKALKLAPNDAHSVHIGKEEAEDEKFVLMTSAVSEDETMDLPVVLEKEEGEWRINLIEAFNRWTLAQPDDEEEEEGAEEELDAPASCPERVWTYTEGLETVEDEAIYALAGDFLRLFSPPFEVSEDQTEPEESEEDGAGIASFRVGDEERWLDIRYRMEADAADDEYIVTIEARGMEPGLAFTLVWECVRGKESGLWERRLRFTASAPEDTLESMDKFLSERI